MTHQFTVSDLGLRLIKAYEGFRPESRTLISGQTVVGYGHRMADQDAIALTPEEAEMLLREDIEPVEHLVNDAIFAPLTQGQFDALCSLAYNIGPDSFKKSDIVKAINNGRPIDAANGFDVWRKGELDGQSFVIDALVRRRTAEKALFLKPERRLVTSPRDSLPPEKDYTLASQISTSAPLYDQDDAAGYVETIAYDQRPNPGRRREDGPAGLLQLSEYDEEETQPKADVPITLSPVDLPPEEIETPELSLDEAMIVETDKPLTLSPIAEAAAEVSNRLDALIDDYDGETTDISDMPDSLIDEPTDEAPAVVLPFRGKETAEDQLSEDQLSENKDMKFIDDPDVQYEVEEEQVEPRNVAANSAPASTIHLADDEAGQSESVAAFVVMLVSGLIMFALSLYAWLNDPAEILGAWGPIATLVGLIMGGVIILGSVYYILKASFLRR